MGFYSITLSLLRIKDSDGPLLQLHAVVACISSIESFSRMIILDNQAHQQMTLHFQLSLQCNVSIHTVCLMKPVMGKTLHWSDNWKWRVICWRAWSSKLIILLSTPACHITFMPIESFVCVKYLILLPTLYLPNVILNFDKGACNFGSMHHGTGYSFHCLCGVRW